MKRDKVVRVRSIIYAAVFALALLAFAGCSNPFVQFAGGWYLGEEAQESGEAGSGSSGDSSSADPEPNPQPGSDPAPGTDPEPAPAPAPAIQPERIDISAASFSLAWDPCDTPTASYRIYYREHGTSEWTLLADDLSSPSLPVDETTIAPGDYDFAVTSVCTAGNESDMHTSLDPTADPETGWYLSWNPAG